MMMLFSDRQRSPTQQQQPVMTDPTNRAMKVAVVVVLSIAYLGVQSKQPFKRDTLFGYPLGQPYYPRPQIGPHNGRGPSAAEAYPSAPAYGPGGAVYNGNPPYGSQYGGYVPGYAPGFTSGYETAPGGYLGYETPSATGYGGFHTPTIYKPKLAGPTISFQRYPTVEEIDAYVDAVAASYPDIAEVKIIGQSAEGRPIRVLKIHSSRAPRNGKPKILVDAGIHAREWIAPVTALYLIQQLVEKNDQHRNLTESLEWHIIPLLNPDGYAYSMSEDRMWRKNRSNTTNPACPGVDLNRNFDLFFGGAGTSTDPCDETFTGSGPFSEPEARTLRDYALSLSGIRLYLTLHSYGQYFLYPWGFGDSLPRDWKDLDKLGRIAQMALQRVRGTKYRVGSSTHLLGAAAGGSDDWMKGRAGVKYSYTVELPGGGERGFDLPPERITSVVQETFEALKSMGSFIATERRRRARRTHSHQK